MSRIAKKPIIVPTGVDLKILGHEIQVKGKKGAFIFPLHSAVEIEINDNLVQIRARGKVHPMVGTTCNILKNMIKGVHEGFERKLTLVGVGYRASVQGKDLELKVGHSHPDLFPIPEGITISTPSATEIIIQGIDKQIVGETAAKIRKVRPPEYYKGKGIRHSDEKVPLKDTKKK